jgi:hypothetical protein
MAQARWRRRPAPPRTTSTTPSVRAPAVCMFVCLFAQMWLPHLFLDVCVALIGVVGWRNIVAGHTVDPASNSLARTMFTMQPAARRPDRLLLFSNHRHWASVRSIQLLGTEPLVGPKDLWMSAHYGVHAVLETAASAAAAATAGTPTSPSLQSIGSHASSNLPSDGGRSPVAGSPPAPSGTTPAPAASAQPPPPPSSASSWDRCVVS